MRTLKPITNKLIKSLTSEEQLELLAYSFTFEEVMDSIWTDTLVQKLLSFSNVRHQAPTQFGRIIPKTIISYWFYGPDAIIGRRRFKKYWKVSDKYMQRVLLSLMFLDATKVKLIKTGWLHLKTL